MNKVVLLFSPIFLSIVLCSCSITKPINNQQIVVVKKDTAQATTQQPSLIDDAIFNNAHVGICVYEPATNTYLYNYQSNKYFIPASNTKIATCYAAMKYLGDSILGLMYNNVEGVSPTKYGIELIGTGDPTFLHPLFSNQPVYDFIDKQKNRKVILYEPISKFVEYTYGKGWAWDDYNESYMVEKSFFPIYGNVARFKIVDSSIVVEPSFFNEFFQYSRTKKHQYFNIRRDKESNNFSIVDGAKNQYQEVPLKEAIDLSNQKQIEIELLNDTMKQEIYSGHAKISSFKNLKKIYSQPTDSLLKPMMHNSDNFFAEQTLLMVSLNQLGFMSDEKIIDTLLKTDFKNLPQKPKWVDGSGLSRYNLFTPQDFVFILNKMKNEFSWQRISTIFPTGDEGTLKGYYKKYQNKIFAKTGTVSNNLSLSGFIKTNSGKDYIFSIIINNHQSSTTDIRLVIEKFIASIIENK